MERPFAALIGREGHINQGGRPEFPYQETRKGPEGYRNPCSESSMHMLSRDFDQILTGSEAGFNRILTGLLQTVWPPPQLTPIYAVQSDAHPPPILWCAVRVVPAYPTLPIFTTYLGLHVVFPTFRLLINSCVFDRVKLIETDQNWLKLIEADWKWLKMTEHRSKWIET